MTLEETLAQGIPRAEAAEYFIRVRGRDKLAALSPAELEAGLAELADRAEIIKNATASHLALSKAGRVKRADGAGAGAPPPTLPATGQGKNMVNATPPPLPTTALGDNKTAALTAQQQKTIDELGSARGRAATSAHFEREKHRGSEKNRELIGRLAGGVGGGAIAHLSAKNPLATIAGAALGQHFGGKSGKRSGQIADAAAWEKKHSEALKWALDASGLAPSHDPALEQALGAQQMQAQQGQPGQPPQAQGVEPVLDPETQQYVDQEQAGEAEAEQMHADMLRQKLQEAQSELQMAQQQAQSGQEAQAGHDQQLAAMQQQIAAATTQATQAQDQVLQNQQAAAAMRMAFQQLRGQVLQLAASDPPMMSTDAQALLASQQAPTQPSPNGQPDLQQGPANQAGAPGTAPGAAAPAGEGDMNQPATGGTTGPATTAPASEKGTIAEAEGSGDNKGSESKPVSVKVGYARRALQEAAAELLPFVGREGVKEALSRELAMKRMAKASPERLEKFIRNVSFRPKGTKMHDLQEHAEKLQQHPHWPHRITEAVKDIGTGAAHQGIATAKRVIEAVHPRSNVKAMSAGTLLPGALAVAGTGAGAYALGKKKGRKKTEKKAALKDFAAAAAGRLLPVLPHAAVGAAVGAGMGAGEAYSSNEPLRQKIESLEAKPDRGYTDTMNLAQAKARHTVGEFAKDHPKTMMGMGAMGGALLGAQSGPGLVDSVRNSARSVANIGKHIKTIAAAKKMKGAA